MPIGPGRFGLIWLFKIMTIYLIRPNQTKPAKVVCYILLDPSHFSINGNTSEVQTIIYSRIHKKQSTESPSLRMEGSKIQKLLRERRIDRLTAVRHSLVKQVMVVQLIDNTLFRLAENCPCHLTQSIGLLPDSYLANEHFS